MPPARGCRSGLSKVVGEVLTELPRLAANGLIADINAALGHEVFNVTEAQCEPKVQPHGLANDIGRKPMAGIRNWRHRLLSPADQPDIGNPMTRTPQHTGQMSVFP